MSSVGQHWPTCLFYSVLTISTLPTTAIRIDQYPCFVAFEVCWTVGQPWPTCLFRRLWLNAANSRSEPAKPLFVRIARSDNTVVGRGQGEGIFYSCHFSVRHNPCRVTAVIRLRRFPTENSFLIPVITFILSYVCRNLPIVWKRVHDESHPAKTAVRVRSLFTVSVVCLSNLSRVSPQSDATTFARLL